MCIYVFRARFTIRYGFIQRSVLQLRRHDDALIATVLMYIVPIPLRTVYPSTGRTNEGTSAPTEVETSTSTDYLVLTSR